MTVTTITTQSQFDDVNAKIKALRYNVDDLRRRSDGTTTANKRCAQLERRLNSTENELQQVIERIKSLGPAAGPIQQEHLKQVFTELNGRLDSLWQDINLQLEDIKETQRFHGEEIDRAHTRIDSVREDLANATIDTSGATITKTPVVSWVVSIIVGAIVGIAVYIAVEVATKDDASWMTWRSVAAGIAVGVAVMAFVSSFEGFILNITAKFRIDDEKVDAIIVPDEEKPPVADTPPADGEQDQTRVYDQDEMKEVSAKA